MKSHYLIAGLIATASSMAYAEVTMERLLAAGSEEEAGNWLMIGKTFDLNRFSPLDQINSGNVENLRLVMAAPIGGMEPAGFGIGSMQTTPLGSLSMPVSQIQTGRAAVSLVRSNLYGVPQGSDR